ncbi:glycosyltransferase family 2 protein [Amycolatopsis thermoflava]|uniref:glycosyltransferase family 2 protein n=1 Tax=Amycolatopsis thermoflava TaxID=84480 RepID=UPI00056525BC|nr:glycosyltransferase family 2 protein [Amycolatopsis thermoflava]
MPTISVITPVHAPSVQHLKDAYASLVSQEMPSGWTWEWIVQEDGQNGILKGALPNDPHISVGQNRNGGPGVTRSLALSRASGELIKSFDADDILTPGALKRDIAAFADPAISWTVSSALDLLPDGSTVSYDTDPPEGLIRRGELVKYWLENDFRSPVMSATICIRREVLYALGGWMALPASEDTALMLCANATVNGYFISTPGLHYRKWPGQVTQDAAHSEQVEREARTQLIRDRVLALLKMDTGVPVVDGLP